MELLYSLCRGGAELQNYLSVLLQSFVIFLLGHVLHLLLTHSVIEHQAYGTNIGRKVNYANGPICLELPPARAPESLQSMGVVTANIFMYTYMYI